MDDIRKKILDTARNRFYKWGFKKVTVDEIVSDLGISKKTVYKFFSGKKELLIAVLEDNQKRIEEIAADYIPNSENVEADIKEFSLKLVEMFGPVMPVLGLEIQNSMPDVWKTLCINKNQILEKINQYLEYGQKRGLINPILDLKMFGDLLFLLIEHMFTPNYIMRNNISILELYNQIFQIVFNGIKLKNIQEKK